MAFRNIFRNRRRSILTGLMMVGGFCMYSFSMAVADGMYGDIIDMFTKNRTGHVQVHRKGYLKRPSLYQTLEDDGRIEKTVAGTPHVASQVKRVYAPTLAFAGVKTTAAQICGVVPEAEAKAMNLDKKVTEGRYLSPAPNEVVIGPGLAEALNAGPGSEIALISQAADGSIANDLFTVVGVLAKKSSPYDRIACYMKIEDAQRFLELAGRIHEIALLLDDQRHARRTAALLADRLSDPDLEADPWQVVEAHFYRAMQADMKGNYVTQFIIMLIVAIGVLNTVLMSILERTREFGVIRALGARPRSVLGMIVLEAAFLSLLAVVLGLAFSLPINYYYSFHGIAIPTPLTWGGMTFEVMRARITIRSAVEPALVTFGAAVLVSVLPALRAARIAPVRAMRRH